MYSEKRSWKTGMQREERSNVTGPGWIEASPWVRERLGARCLLSAPPLPAKHRELHHAPRHAQSPWPELTCSVPTHLRQQDSLDDGEVAHLLKFHFYILCGIGSSLYFFTF